MVEFRQIRYAIAVAKERSFTRAAARLNISQSAVSEQVKLLEERIGFALLTRTGSGVEVTERGRVFLHEAERVANDVMGLADVARHLRGVAVDKLSVGIISGLAPIILPRMFPKKGMPENVQLEVHTAPTRVIFNDLAKGRLDIGFAIEVEPDLVPAGLSVSRFFDVEIVLIAPPGHPLAAGKAPVKLARVANEPMIMSELSVGYGRVVMNMLSDLGIRPRIQAVVDNVETMKVMVQLGMGLALIPEGAADSEVELGLLESLRIAPAHQVTIYSYRPREGYNRHREALHAEILGSLGT